MKPEVKRELKAAFGERLRAMRKGKGLSQEALAHECELDRTYIGGVERGERNIGLINMYRIAAALKVSPSAFFIDEKENS